MNRWYHPAFQTDLVNAARYIEEQRSGFGVKFLDAAEAAVETIMRSPRVWRIRRDGIRRFLIECPAPIRIRSQRQLESVFGFAGYC